MDESSKVWEAKLKEVSEKFQKALPKKIQGRGKARKQRKEEGNNEMAVLAADLALESYLKVFCGWKNIALVMRNKRFAANEEHLIDIFDIECKEWGFLLREVFGLRLGTGDYGHIAIEHASMLLRNHRSIGKMSNQGFEASHKTHRQLYLRATSHDAPGDSSSVDQIMTHQYAANLLFLRLSFRKALHCLEQGTPFFFPGCHWPASKRVLWNDKDQVWIKRMDDLMTSMFADDFPRYTYEKKVTPEGIKNGACVIYPDDIPSYKYNHDEWEVLCSREPPVSADLSDHCSSPVSTDKSDYLNPGSPSSADLSDHCSSPVSTDKSDHLNPGSPSFADLSDHCSSSMSTDKSDYLNPGSPSSADLSDHCSSPVSTDKFDHLNPGSPSSADLQDHCSSPMSTDKADHLNSWSSPSSADLQDHCSSPVSTDKSDYLNPGSPSSADLQDHCSSPVSTDKSDYLNPGSPSSADLQDHCSSPMSTDKADHLNPGSPSSADLPDHCSFPKSRAPDHADQPSASLNIRHNAGLTRGEIASLELPPTTFILSRELEVINKNECHHVMNPYVLCYRPPKSIVDEALKMLRKKVNSEVIQDDEAESEYVIKLGKLGYFTREALDVLKSFCDASETKRRVEEEMSWLRNDDCRIKDILLSLHPNEEFISLGNRSMDATDFSNLVGERYVDGYTIDIACLNAIEQSEQKAYICYLPSHTPVWATSGIEFLKEKLDQFVCGTSMVHKIICPIHVNGCHWGLLYIDLEEMVSYYDDGMNIDPPRNICLVANNIVKVLGLLGCNMPKQWNDLEINELRRMGMPRQPKGGEGSSSCGIGVIFAVRDIVNSSVGVPHFTWSFKNSSKLRKTIMYELISLREGTSNKSN